MNCIDIQNLTKYYGRSKGIENINLEIPGGEIFGFIGPNGAGKSTTIRILLNLIFPTSGSARIFGMDVIKESKKIKSRIGYIPSDADLYDRMDVKEFLHYFSRFYPDDRIKNRIRELTDIFELDPGRKLAELSAGNKKKVSIIQGLLHSPDLLILDEPTTGLDPLIKSRFFELLRSENKKGMTIFFSSHILSEVQNLCKSVAIIKDGNIMKVEDIETLRKKQFKKITVTVLPGYNTGDLRIKGMESVDRSDNGIITFIYSGEINNLVKELSNLQIDDLRIEEPTLEEIFMHYYN